MEIGLAYPTLRLFARNDRPAEGRLTVHVLFRTPDNVSRQLKIADLSAGTEWQPTRVVLILANFLALHPSWDGKVAFRFTANGGELARRRRLRRPVRALIHPLCAGRFGLEPTGAAITPPAVPRPPRIAGR